MPQLSAAFRGDCTNHFPAPFSPFYPQLPLGLGASFFEASNLLSVSLSPQTSLLVSFQLSTFDTIFSSSFPVSSRAAVIKAKYSHTDKILSKLKSYSHGYYVLYYTNLAWKSVFLKAHRWQLDSPLTFFAREAFLKIVIHILLWQ